MAGEYQILEQWDCGGLIFRLVDGTTSSTDGRVLIDVRGHAWLEMALPGPHMLATLAKDQVIVGTTIPQGLQVEVAGAMPSRVTFDSNTGLSVVVWDFIEAKIGQAPASPTGTVASLKCVRVLGPCAFKYAGRLCRLDAIHHQADRRPGLISGRLTIDGGLDYAPVSCLLTLAQRCLIGAPMVKVHDGPNIALVVLRPNASPYEAGNPLIPRDGAKLANFLEQTLPAFQAKSAGYELGRLIEYYGLSVQNSFGEIKFILASVLMEAFKFFWAKNVAQKTPDLKANGLIRGFIKSYGKKGKPVNYTFEELLTEACASLNYSTTFTFVEDRNALFHSGAPGGHQHGATSTWAALRPELVTLYRQIDDILLTLLGYAGPILRWDTPDQEDAFP